MDEHNLFLSMEVPVGGALLLGHTSTRGRPFPRRLSPFQPRAGLAHQIRVYISWVLYDLVELGTYGTPCYRLRLNNARDALDG